MGFSFLFLIFLRRECRMLLCHKVYQYHNEGGRLNWDRLNIIQRTHSSVLLFIQVPRHHLLTTKISVDRSDRRFWMDGKRRDDVSLSELDIYLFSCHRIILPNMCCYLCVCVEDCRWWKHLLLQARIRNTLQRRRIGHVALESLIHIRVWPLGVTLVWYSRIQP